MEHKEGTMQYRASAQIGEKLSILGLGCMRFSRNMAETERMILAAVEGGVNYFDTAYIYAGSEETLGNIVSKNRLRSRINIATKLPLVSCKGPESFDRFFNKQLERLRTDYIDFYLMHMITDAAQCRMLLDWGIERWIDEKKREGRIRYAGFSFHGSGVEFQKVLEMSRWEFCQIQYNYSNENYQAGKEGLKAAAAKGLPVIIMEPLLGGRLATGLPAEARKLLAELDPALSPAAWGLRWLWNQPEVTSVLSGMNTVAQMRENIRAAENFAPLSAAEAEAFVAVREILSRAYKINCTGCNYCMPCPQGINIPECFAAYNASFAQGFVTGLQLLLTSSAAMGAKPCGPRTCIRCGKCERHCPQSIAIPSQLQRLSKRLEPLPVRAAVRIARYFLRR
ncbi:MAG: aldo/keto reductase [Tannerellaceae bacterium]|jgi:predicted aldo/keto reductase-like oxidoreductase|nr:aldo/keto reductase [Tannerellaceae bacterium]